MVEGMGRGRRNGVWELPLSPQWVHCKDIVGVQLASPPEADEFLQGKGSFIKTIENERIEKIFYIYSSTFTFVHLHI